MKNSFFLASSRTIGINRSWLSLFLSSWFDRSAIAFPSICGSPFGNTHRFHGWWKGRRCHRSEIAENHSKPATRLKPLLWTIFDLDTKDQELLADKVVALRDINPSPFRFPNLLDPISYARGGENVIITQRPQSKTIRYWVIDICKYLLPLTITFIVGLKKAARNKAHQLKKNVKNYLKMRGIRHGYSNFNV